MAKNDVAIYTPSARALYEAGQEEPVGGAERQVAMLASALAQAGLQVAHIVFRVQRFRPPAHERITVVQRQPSEGKMPVPHRLRDTVAVWRSLAEADAEVYVVRMATAALATVALFCRAHRRKLVFAAASDKDFTFESVVIQTHGKSLAFRLGARLADLIVVQTAQQQALARRAFPRVAVTEIPSFAEPAARTARDATCFVWVGRLMPEKSPLEYIDLAQDLPDARFRMVAWDTNQAPTELVREVRRRADGTPNLEVSSAMPREQVLALIEQAAAVVVTSSAEGMPNVCLEGWARGIPTLTLAFDPDGLIHERGLGLAAGGSWEAFVEGARRLWNERAQRDQFADATRQYVAANHGLAAVGQRWRQALDDLRSGRRFAFGQNWRRFVETIDEERCREAERSLEEVLGPGTVGGRTFLDAGAGSGLSSLAAVRLGASRVHSFDLDPDSLAAAQELKRRFCPSAEHWTIGQGSVLDIEYIEALGEWDIVYSWGVIHHTGHMQQALETVIRPVAPGGRLFLAVYNHQGTATRGWAGVKRVYNLLPSALRLPYTLTVWAPHELRTLLSHLARRDLAVYVRLWTGYKRSRGMSRWHDIVDWVGGYPFEAARPEQIVGFYRASGFELETLNATDGSGCNEFVFRRAGASEPMG